MMGDGGSLEVGEVRAFSLKKFPSYYLITEWE